MKKIAQIIDNCIDCRFAERYNHPDVFRCAAFICTRMNPQRLAGFDGDSGIIQVPDWCPLETYKEADPSEARPDTPFAPSTLVLPGMPGLEWMTENLSGFGGTEVDGRWYYTWDEAMEAAGQLGDGWRLPTREEFVQLCDLGSTWDDERRGRWFGGNHGTDHKGSLFFPAAGYRLRDGGALTRVGAEGDVWCSSTYAFDNINAGFLYFGATWVSPLNGTGRAYGLSVRCVQKSRRSEPRETNE